MARSAQILVLWATLVPILSAALPVLADEDDGSVAVPSGKEIEERTSRRFPGAKTLSLVKVLRWAEGSPGPCQADFAGDETDNRVDLESRVAGGAASPLRDAPVSALVASGWTTAYRTPAGVGFEKLADFHQIDLTSRQSLVCRCFDGQRPVERHPTTLRLRWEKGSLPEVSARVGRGAGLRPAITAGRLVTYDFTVERRFPGDRGRCAGHLSITLLIDPPLL